MKNQSENYKNKFIESNDKFNTIFNLSSAASKILDSDLNIIKVNPALVELMGFSAETLEGTKILDYVCPEYKEHWHNLQEALWKKKVPFFKLEACLIKKDTSLVWVNVTTVLFKENDETYGFTILDDFTPRKILEESEKKLKQALDHSETIKTILTNNERHLAQILETMAEGVGIINSNGKLTYTNPMAQKIFGQNQLEIISQKYNDPAWQNFKLDGSPLSYEEHPLAVMMSSGSPVYDSEIAVQPPDADRIYISINAAPLYDDNGTFIEGVGTFTNVTNRHKLDQLKDDFINVASHELRTPVTSLKAALQLLNEVKDKPSSILMPKLIDQANRSLNKLSILIADLLNANRLKDGQLILNKTLFKLSKLIDDCCDNIRVIGKYTISTEGALDQQVHGDMERLEQVIVNLVNNAIKYAEESKVIKVRIEKLATFAKVSIIDKGPGISPDKIPFLFDRYYRVKTDGNQFAGLGLGLYICSQIIKKHGGQMGVESELGVGSTFWFTLPLS